MGCDTLMDIENLCMNCFEELRNGNICQECGYDNDTVVDTMYLQPKTVLNDRYTIGAVIAHESDAAVYMAYDNQLNSKIKIREFLPKGMANRLEGNLDIHIRERYRASFQKLRTSFVNLWKTIVKMRNLSAVIPTYDVFELNGTAYAVMEYTESISLREFLLRNPDGNILWDKARLMFMPVLTTLEALHANGIIHGAICPDNLLLCRDGKIRLKSFCITEANTMGSELEFCVNEGYTALEQYDNKHKICPATDIYAFSACIFRALVGQNPPDAKSRETNDKLMIPNSIAENIPTHIIRALGGGLQVYPERRTQTVDVFREQLNASPSVVAASANNIVTDREDTAPDIQEELNNQFAEADKPAKNGKGVKIAIIVLVIMIIAAIGAGIYVTKSGILEQQTETTTQPPELEKYTVPNFITAGYTQSDIQNNAAWNKQFTITFVGEYSKDYEEGIVFEQSIKAGDTVEEGTEIVLKVSKGVETEEVPDVGGMTLDDATQKLTELGFKVSTVEIYNDGGNKPNTVKSSFGMAPSAGSVVPIGEEIILQVYGAEVTTTEPETTAQPTNE